MWPMKNFYDHIRTNPGLTRLEIGNLLFSEYNCPIESKLFEIWAQLDYIVYVISGEKTWHTTDGSFRIRPGDTLFFKKGGAIIEQHFGADFCVFIFFLDDDTIQEVLRECNVGTQYPQQHGKCAISLERDTCFTAFIDSIKRYFLEGGKPDNQIILLKLKELILSLATSGKNPEVASYLQGIAWGKGPSIEQIMESNFRYRLGMDEFAKLCGCSLSKFKRDFAAHFQEPPGKWIQRKRLEYAAGLLRSQNDLSVTDVYFESGFEDSSHFSSSFKKYFGQSPREYRSSNNPSGL